MTDSPGELFFRMLNGEKPKEVVFRLENIGITGKRGERVMRFNLETIAVMNNGDEIQVASKKAICEEGHVLDVVAGLPFTLLEVEGDPVSGFKTLLKRLMRR